MLEMLITIAAFALLLAVLTILYALDTRQRYRAIPSDHLRSVLAPAIRDFHREATANRERAELARHDPLVYHRAADAYEDAAARLERLIRAAERPV